VDQKGIVQKEKKVTGAISRATQENLEKRIDKEAKKRGKARGKRVHLHQEEGLRNFRNPIVWYQPRTETRKNESVRDTKG